MDVQFLKSHSVALDGHLRRNGQFVRRIGEGCSRRVYDTPYDKVMKLSATRMSLQKKMVDNTWLKLPAAMTEWALWHCYIQHQDFADMFAATHELVLYPMRSPYVYPSIPDDAFPVALCTVQDYTGQRGMSPEPWFRFKWLNDTWEGQICGGRNVDYASIWLDRLPVDVKREMLDTEAWAAEHAPEWKEALLDGEVLVIDRFRGNSLT